MNMSKPTMALMLLLIAALNACSSREPTGKDFVGTWKSSRVTTPIRLYENDEWELMANDGEVMQYGVWQYFDNKIMWSYMVDEAMGHDTNPILSAAPREFKLRERDGSITTFSKVD
jgi:hypothetical protein